jgi:hypothetical protein
MYRVICEWDRPAAGDSTASCLHVMSFRSPAKAASCVEWFLRLAASTQGMLNIKVTLERTED